MGDSWSKVLRQLRAEAGQSNVPPELLVALDVLQEMGGRPPRLEWAIELDGRVKTFSVNPRRLRKSPLERCFKDAFARFRYRPGQQRTQMGLFAKR